MSCSIAAGALFDCDQLPQAGVNSRLLVGNLEEIESIVDCPSVSSVESSSAASETSSGVAVDFLRVTGDGDSRVTGDDDQREYV